MNISFTDLTYFLEVTQTENISRAAERLGITQPSLSSAIKRLEDSVATKLLIRGKTGVKLTKAGEELLKKGRAFLAEWEELKLDIDKKTNTISGQYIIGCHPSVAMYSLSKFLPKLIQKNPSLEIKLVHDLSRKITDAVINYEVDFGIVVNPTTHDDLVIKELCTDQVMFWTSTNPSSTQEVNSENSVLICDLNLLQVQKLINDLKKKKIKFNRVIQTGSLEVVTDLTSSGVGVGVIPKRVGMRMDAKKLTPLRSDLPLFKDRICLVYRADLQQTKASKEIVKQILNSDWT